MKKPPYLAINLLWAALAIGAFFGGSIFTRNQMSRGGEGDTGVGVADQGGPVTNGQGRPASLNSGEGQKQRGSLQGRTKPAYGSAPREKYVKRVVITSSKDFANLVKTDLDEAKRVFALVEVSPTDPHGITRQTWGSMIVNELLARDLDLAISFSDQQSIWWSSVSKLAAEIEKQRGVGGLLAWIEKIEYRDAEGQEMEYKKAAAGVAIGIVAGDDPERARNWVIANAGQPHVSRAMLQQIAGNVDENVALQLKWLAELPIDAEDQRECIAGVFGGYVSSDLQAAGRWLAEQERKPMHDRAIQKFADAAATFDMEAAQKWAEEISEEALRTETLERLERRSR